MEPTILKLLEMSSSWLNYTHLLGFVNIYLQLNSKLAAAFKHRLYSPVSNLVTRLDPDKLTLSFTCISILLPVALNLAQRAMITARINLNEEAQIRDCEVVNKTTQGILSFGKYFSLLKRQANLALGVRLVVSPHSAKDGRCLKA